MKSVLITSKCGGYIGDPIVNEEEEPLTAPGTIPLPDPDEMDQPLIPPEFTKRKYEDEQK